MSGLTRFSRRTFLVLSAASLAACRAESGLLELAGQTMGTQYNVLALTSGTGADRATVAQAIETALAEVNGQMSNWDAGSEISRINAAGAGKAIALSPALAEVLASADAVHRASDGRFDVTVGPLIDLWGFGAGREGHHVPADAEIAAALAITGQGRMLALDEGRLRKADASAEIYLPAIGKGYGVDRVAKALRGLGLTDFMVEIGGDLYTTGRNPDGQPWQIGIENPTAGERSLASVVGVSGRGMATSGDYRNFFETGGRRYSHMIDPATGRPITHGTVSATVITDNAMLADAWSTALLVLGRARGLEIAEAEGLAVSFIERDGSSGFRTVESSRFGAGHA